MAKFKTVAKSLPEETKKDEYPGPNPVVFAAAEISAIRSRLEDLAGGLDNVYDLTGLADSVEPEQHKAVIDGASYFITIVKDELLRLSKHFEESLERSKAGGAA